MKPGDAKVKTVKFNLQNLTATHIEWEILLCGSSG